MLRKPLEKLIKFEGMSGDNHVDCPHIYIYTYIYIYILVFLCFSHFELRVQLDRVRLSPIKNTYLKSQIEFFQNTTF